MSCGSVESWRQEGGGGRAVVSPFIHCMSPDHQQTAQVCLQWCYLVFHASVASALIPACFGLVDVWSTTGLFWCSTVVGVCHLHFKELLLILAAVVKLRVCCKGGEWSL